MHKQNFTANRDIIGLLCALTAQILKLLLLIQKENRKVHYITFLVERLHLLFSIDAIALPGMFHSIALKYLSPWRQAGDTIWQMRMYSFMGGGLFCAGIGNILLIVSTATDYWMQYRHASNYMHQGLWRYCVPGKCMTHTDSIAYWDATRAFMILSLLACFIGIVIGIMAFIHYSSFDSFDKTFAAGILFFISCFFVLLAMAVYTGVTVNYYGKRYGSWRFSWSYIMGWVAVVLTFFSGIFYMCAYRMHECPRNSNSR